MYRLKAFGAFPTITKNPSGEINPLGELSAYAQTFAVDRGIYNDTTKPNSLLYSFASFNEISAVETQPVEVPPVVASLVLEIMETLYTQASNNAFGPDELVVKDYLLNNWTGQIQNVVVGTMISDGVRWLPTSILFEGTSTTSPYSVQLWFSDTAFRNEYDLYTIKVVAPIDTIDRFFGAAADIQAMVNSEITLVRAMEKIAVAAGDAPFTQAVTQEFEWIDPENNAVRVTVPWTVVVYGDAGRNVDSIRKALSDWIVQNSSYGEDQWMLLFPDIFGATEFIFTPYWTHVAIPDDAVNGGIYSPVNNLKAQYTMSKAVIAGVGYTDTYIDDNLEGLNTTYKSLQMGVIGGYRNRDGVNQFGNRWPDYIAVSTASIDFKRMSDSTKQLITILTEMLQVAETMTATSAIPRGYMRLERNGVLYLTTTYERTTLIVVSRLSMQERFVTGTGATLTPVS